MRNAILLVLFVFLLACASVDGPYMANASADKREVAIKEEFQRRAAEALRENGIILERESADELRLLWQMAARRLVEDDASQSEVSRAVSNVSRVVNAAAGQSLPASGGSKQITLEGYERAKVSLCPGFYPFC